MDCFASETGVPYNKEEIIQSLQLMNNLFPSYLKYGKNSTRTYALGKLYTPLHYIASFVVHFIGEETKGLRNLQFSW